MLSISEEAVKSNEQVLEQLFHGNFRRVYAFVRSRLSEADATDITSDVFHAATAAIRRGETVSGAWLMTVARNKVFDHWRRDYQRRAKAHLIAGRPDDRVSWPHDWDDDPRREAVDAALAVLNDRHRTLLMLHHIDGLTIAELAEATGDSQSAIESALARARKRFGVIYKEYRDA